MVKLLRSMTVGDYTQRHNNILTLYTYKSPSAFNITVNKEFLTE